MAVRHRRRLFGLAATLLAVASFGLAAFWQPLRSSVTEAPPEAPDTLLLFGSPSNGLPAPALTGVGLFRPETGTFDPLLEYPVAWTVSPDDRDLFFVLLDQAGDEKRIYVTDLAGDTLRQRWRVTLGIQDSPLAKDQVFQLAASRDRVYVISRPGAADDRIRIVALDRVDGFLRRAWQADAGGRKLTLQQAWATNGQQLHVIGADGQGSVLIRFQLPDGAQISPAQTISSPLLTGPSSAWQPMPDGQWRYRVGRADAGGAIQFLNLATVTVESVDLSLPPPYELGVSPDGRQLLVLSAFAGQLAIVNLVERRMEQVVKIEANPTAFARAAELSGVPERLQVSPDGERVYGAAPVNAEGSVFAIDTHDWRVVGRWLPGVAPAQLALSGDGRRLLVQEPTRGNGPTVGAVHEFDTTTGAELATSGRLPWAVLHSIKDLFQQSYGHRPAAPSLLPTPIAHFTVTGEPKVATSGNVIHIEARFRDPRTGQPLQAAQSDVQFEPPLHVTAHLIGAGSQHLAVQLHPSGFGVYKGNVAAPDTRSNSLGTWSLEAEAVWPGGVSRHAEVNGTLLFSPAFSGTDGRKYVLRLASTPARPLVDHDVMLQVAVVDAEDETPLPAGVDLIDGLPERLEIGCYGAGFVSRSFERITHSAYAGTLKLWASGPWRVWADVPQQSRSVGRFFIATLDVLDPPSH